MHNSGEEVMDIMSNTIHYGQMTITLLVVVSTSECPGDTSKIMKL